MATIGFIGLGNMGAPMAINLVKAGHNVRVYNRSHGAIEKLAAEGAYPANSATDAAEGADFFISMLPADKDIDELYVNGNEPLFNVLNKNSIIIDCSTIDAETAKNMAVTAAERNIGFIDAPVSGGVSGATAGTLTFIVGATEDQLTRITPILDCMGKNIMHAGPPGAGQTAKACNNMLLSILMCGTAEAINMGIKAGLDPKVLSEIMSKSSGNNWALQSYNPYPGLMENIPAANNYQGGFQSRLMLKDLGLAMDTAQTNNADTPMGKQAFDLYKQHLDAGNGELDFSSIMKRYT